MLLQNLDKKKKKKCLPVARRTLKITVDADVADTFGDGLGGITDNINSNNNNNNKQ